MAIYVLHGLWKRCSMVNHASKLGIYGIRILCDRTGQ